MTDILEILQYIDNNPGSSFFYTPLKKGDDFSYIFKSPAISIESCNKETIDETLSKIDELKAKYPFAFGYIAYEVGYSFEERLDKLLEDKSNSKLISYHFFNSSSVEKIRTRDICFSKIGKKLSLNDTQINNFRLNTDYKSYQKNIQKIKDLIAKGDTYQVNYTLKSHFDFDDDIITLFLRMLFNQSASYTAIINDSDRFIISISPELFFKTEGKEIISKPMKGTIKRGRNLYEDKIQMEQLASSVKDKAENIMIVDLLRNDLGKISEIDSVVAHPVYEIEKYETVFQMTSTVKGILKENSFKSIIQNLFPCGSITGAPKIRTMEIVKELEREERGVYTGTIGIIENKNYTFNIPIRTIVINKADKKGELGIGGGIVWDSDSLHEFNEAELKGKFVTKPVKYFELIETMLVENGKLFLLDYHIKRLKDSAYYFLFFFDETKILKSIIDIVDDLDSNKKYRFKILLSKWGGLNIDVREVIRSEKKSIAVISNNKINSMNKFQFFKTTNRELYDKEYDSHKNDYVDVLFLNEKGNLSEGAITNIIIKKGDKYFTPPIEDGILNGCYREHLLKTRKEIEVKSFGMDELHAADELILINSVRKEIKISELYKDGNLIKKYF